MAFEKELREFVCMQCGWCCELSGYVRVTREEVDRIADYLGITTDTMLERYTTTMPWDEGKSIILIDHPGTTRCIFLNDGDRCIVHPVKPEQCRTFPSSWKRTGATLHCKGLKWLREREGRR